MCSWGVLFHVLTLSESETTLSPDSDRPTNWSTLKATWPQKGGMSVDVFFCSRVSLPYLQILWASEKVILVCLFLVGTCWLEMVLKGKQPWLVQVCVLVTFQPYRQWTSMWVAWLAT